jgi:hypothetical protein
MNPKQQTVDRAPLRESIDSALGFLRSEQTPHGEFNTYMVLSQTPDDPGVLDPSPFTTSHVLYCLSFLKDGSAREMTNRALEFLTAEAESPGVWRFWTSRHPRFIPPDMDDTCCASYAFKIHSRAPDNTKLILAHRDSKGLFRTWLIPPYRAVPRFPRFSLSSWRERSKREVFFRDTEADPDDVDCVVNANAILYLQERKETRAAIKYLCDVIANNREEACDKWYLSRFAVYYMISRAYHSGVLALGPTRDKIVRLTIDSLAERGSASKSLEIALAACTLMNFGSAGEPLTRAIELLLQEQDSTGHWARCPFYYGGPKKVFNWGSRELTTAICLEALARFPAHGIEGPRN